MTIEELLQSIFGAAGSQGAAGTQSGASATDPLSAIFGAAGVPGAPGAQSGAGAPATPGRYGPFLRVAPTGVPPTVGVEGAQGSPSGGAAPRAPFGPFIQPAPTGDPATAGVQGQPGSPSGTAVQAPVNLADRSQLGAPYDSGSAAGGQTPASAPATTASIPARPAPNLSLPDNKPSIMEKIGGVFAGLSGPDALATYEASNDKRRGNDQMRFAQNATFKALIGKGLDEDTAKAAVLNPTVLTSVLPSVFGGGMTDDVKEYMFDMKQRTQRGEKDLPTLGTWMRETRRTNMPIKVDTATGTQLIDPLTHEVIATVPKDIAGAAQQRMLGGATGKAQTSLPDVVNTATTTLTQIDDVLNDPQLPRNIGPVDARLPNVTGDANRFQSKIDQLKGQSFLQAYATLRGAGAITEVEGQKATEAIARLNEKQSEGDFKKALADLKAITQRGLAKAQAMAAGDFSGSTIPGSEITRGGAPAPAPAPSSGGWSAKRVN